MSKLISFPKARELSAEAKLDDHIEQAATRFEKLKSQKIFNKDTNWEDNRWLYQANGGGIVVLCNSPQEQDSPELIDALRVYLIKYLWNRRLKSPLPKLESIPFGFRVLIQKSGIRRLHELNQDTYDTFLNGIKNLSVRTQVSRITSANSVIMWLQSEHLLTTNIDIVRAPSLAKLPVISRKMPSRDLVQAILEAKWKVQEAEDDSLRWHNDMLSVLAQSFQYGMGLRIGEVLRLPVNPLKRIDGRMFFIVWTEKGSAPLARYVPKEWEEIFEYTVDEIKRITAPFRERAKQLEERGRLKEVEDRFARYHKERMAEVAKRNGELEAFLVEKRKEAERRWWDNMRGAIDDYRYYSPEEVNDLVPDAVASDAKKTPMKVKALKNCGLQFEQVPISRTQNKHRVKGAAVRACIQNHIDFRATHVTDQELLTILHGRKLTREYSKDTEFRKRRIQREGGFFRAYTMRESAEFRRGGKPAATFSLKDARELIQLYAEGGFDSAKYIDVKSFQRLFPDLFTVAMSSYTASHSHRLPKPLRISDKIAIWTKTAKDKRTHARYTKTTGYVLEQESVHELILDRFKSINLNIERELYEESLELDESANKELAVVIDSRSFRTLQKPSDYLMLGGEMDRGGGKQLIPAILSYTSIQYSFKGGGRHNKEGLFQRYGVTDDKELTKEFQTHKGRHWKTTSLFRSGASDEVVNLWMGRHPSQGPQYDHNSDVERAKILKAAMKADSNRFLGAVAIKLRQLQEKNAHPDVIDDFLDSELMVVQHTPTGQCSRELAIKPCDITMRCLHGKDGKGCKHLTIDLADIGQIERIRAWADNEQREVTRLQALLEEGYAGAQMHLNAKMPTLNNAKKVLSAHNKLLAHNKAQEGLLETDIRAFKIEGSDPSDCPFECGE